jgi:2-methylcitrate dehydratase PrpD
MGSEEQPSSLSSIIAAHIAQSAYENLAKTTVIATKRAILDGLGVMLAASGSSPDILPFVELARVCGGSPHATMLGFGERVSLPMAALVNGAMAHALDFEDAFDLAPTHPNASLLPAAFSVAEARGSVSGRDFIVAVATGCDLVCRLALSLRQPLEDGGWYPPPSLGAFGATAAVARLLRLVPAQITDAFSLLLCQNVCPGEIKYSANSTLRAVREAFPAQAAVLSALLAERGVRGFDSPLEGWSGFYALFAAGKYESADMLGQLGERNWIEQLSFKKWPSCRGTHPYIEAAQVLLAVHDFEPEEVAHIKLRGDELQRMLCEPPAQKRVPQTIIDAKFSLPFTVAAALMLDEITLGSFTPSSLREPRLLELAEKVEFQSAGNSSPQRAAAGEMTIFLADGRALHHSVRHSMGDPSRPLSETDLRAKFIDCASRAARPLTVAAAEQLADKIMSLENEPDTGAIITALG